MMTPLNAVSKCTPRSRSLASRTNPRRLLVANGAYLTCVVRMIWGENGADLGRGRGPWTVQVSFKPEVEREARPGEVAFGFFEASSSRYADPEAEGVTPVFKTADS